MSILMLDLADNTELIFEKDKTGTIKISYRTISQSEIEIGSLGYSDITLLETFLAVEKFPQVAVPAPSPTKPVESGEFIDRLMKVLETYLAKIIEKQPAESAGSIKVEQKKEKVK